MPPKGRESRRWELDATTTLGCLRGAKAEPFARRRGQGPPDLEGPGLEIRILPLEAQELSLPHARGYSEHVQRLKPVPAGGR